MTGVEAVSNGVGAFRDPPVDNARTTLSIIVGILLHNKRAAMLKALLLVRADEDIDVINVPWYLSV